MVELVKSLDRLAAYEAMGLEPEEIYALRAQLEREKNDPQTNADRIRAMSDEELAHFLHSYKECAGNCIVGAGLKVCFFRCEHEEGLLDWLRAPACKEATP